MGLLDLKSDLSKAFKRFPKEGKLEKMAKDPHASSLNYDPTPKKYKIPNKGLGANVKYDRSTSSHQPFSKFAKVDTTPTKTSGRHNESDFEAKQTNPSGRHENIDKQINEMAPTPAKIAVEPIAMSATPPKQGLTPKLMTEPVEKVGITPSKPNPTPEKVGTDVTKIPLTKGVENQSPEIDDRPYSLDIGMGTLFDIDSGRSKFDIDDIPTPYLTNPVTTKYAAFNPTISVFGANVPTSYTVDLDQAVDILGDRIHADANFFTDHIKVNPDDDSLANHVPSNVSPYYNKLFDLSNFLDVKNDVYLPNGQTELNIDQYTETSLNIGAKNYFPSTFNPQGSIGTGNIPGAFYEGDVAEIVNLYDLETVTWYNQFGEISSVEDNYTYYGVNFFQYNEHDRMLIQDVSSNPWNGFATTPTEDITAAGITTPPVPLDTNYNFLNFENLDTGNFSVRGVIGWDSNGAPEYIVHDNTGLDPKQQFFNDISEGFTEHTNLASEWTDGLIWPSSYTFINDANQIVPSMYSTLSAVNYFENTGATGFTLYAPTAVDWSSGTDTPSQFIGVSEGNYNNPGLYSVSTGPGQGVNYFDVDMVFTSQGFKRNSLTQGNAMGPTDYINVSLGGGLYTGANINNNQYDGVRGIGYGHGSLFQWQMNYWKQDARTPITFYTEGAYTADDENIAHLGDIHGPRRTSYTQMASEGHTSQGNGSTSFSAYADENSSIFNHQFEETPGNRWPYFNIIGPDSTWGNSWVPTIQEFDARTSWSGAPIPYYYNSANTSAGPNAASSQASGYNRLFLLQSFIRTDSVLGAGDSADGDSGKPLYITNNETDYFHHPMHKPEDGYYGWGLGHKSFTDKYNQLHSNTLNIRKVFGNKHVTYMADQLTIDKESDWGNYANAPRVYGAQAGMSTILGIGSGGGDVHGSHVAFINPAGSQRSFQGGGGGRTGSGTLDLQLFQSTGAGIDSMGGMTYEKRMAEIDSRSDIYGRSMGGQMMQSLNPFDNLSQIFDQLAALSKRTVRRSWEQHNRFSVLMGKSPPQGTHQGLPHHKAGGAIGRYTAMIPGGLGTMASGIFGQLAKKYWSVADYPGLAMMSSAVETGIVRINDFRMFISDMGANHITLAGVSNYINNNRHKGFGMPHSGDPGVERKTYTKTIPKMGDKITQEGIVTGDQVADRDAKDFIKFDFKDVVNNEVFRFRAYISGLTDTAQPNWGQYNYVGRPDPIFHYNGTGARSLSFQLKVAALARQDMYWMWKKINKLYGLCYPAKYDQNQYMVGPLMELTIGDYVVSQPGFLNSLNVTVGDNYPWEINLESHAGDFTDNIGSALGTVTNAVNDPLGFGANMLMKDMGAEDGAARKWDKNYGPDEKGIHIAQLPHIVDLSIGYTIIGSHAKHTKGLHFGSKTGDNAAFFKDWDKADGESTFTEAGSILGGVGDFLGL